VGIGGIRKRRECVPVEDYPPVFILTDRGTGQRYVIPTKATDESTIRLLLATRTEESLTVYTDGFRADEPLDKDDAFNRECVVHGDGEYTGEEIHVNTWESYIEESLIQADTVPGSVTLL
jgi:transposase-like protein